MNLNGGDTLHIERSSDLPRRAENGSHSSVFTEMKNVAKRRIKYLVIADLYLMILYIK